MIMGYSLVRSLVKNTLKYVGDGLTGGIIPVGSIAAGMFEDWCESKPEASPANQPASAVAQQQLRTELEKIVQDNAAFRQQIETALAEMRQSEDVREQVRAYLYQMPRQLQASLRRPEDPTGRTAPASLVIRSAEDMQQLLPERMPRFKPGDRPVLGTDLVVQELLGVGGFGEVWKAVHTSRPQAKAV